MAAAVAATPAPAATAPSIGTPMQQAAPQSYGAAAPSWAASQPVGTPPPPAAPSYAPPPVAANYAAPINYAPTTPPPAASYANVSMAPTAGATPNAWGGNINAGYAPSAAPWPVAQPMFVYKGVGPRFVALLLDGLIVGIPSYLLMGILFKDQMMSMAYGNTSAMTGPYLFMMAISLAYSILLEAGGGTLGKRIMGMKIVDAQGNKPGLGKSLVRNLLRIVDALPFAYIVGLITVASSQTKQRVGDKAAGTYVVAK